MALTNQELTDKVDAIIVAINNIQVAITNLAAKKQLEQLNFLNQREISDLKDRMAAAEADIQFIKDQL
jgi:hypothetical protein